jgi:phosphoenolpyruvate synthase/pyruvate phosphate dikinase
MMKLQLENKKWQFYYSRTYCLLGADLQYMGYNKYAEQEYGFKTKTYSTIMVNNHFFVPVEIAEELSNKFAELVDKDISIIEHYYERTEKKCSEVLEATKKAMKNVELEKLTLPQLYDFWLKVLGPLFLDMPHFWIPWLIIENNLLINKLIDEVNKQIQDEEKSKKIITDLLKTGVQDDFIATEMKELIKFSAKINKALGEKEPTLENVKKIISKNFSGEFNNHVKKFGFLNVLSLEFKPPYKEDYFLERIKENIINKNLTLPELKVNPYEQELTEKAKYLLKWSRKYASLLNISIEQIYEAIYSARPLFSEIAKRLGLTFNDLIYLLIEEISQALITGKLEEKTRREIAKRKSGFAFYLDNHRTGVLVGDDYKRIKEQLMKTIKVKGREVEKEEDVIKGNIGNRGYAKGKIKVVLDEKEAGKVNAGDILVCTMTSPPLVSAMEKAAAIVTDEGGILCHAAVIGREFNKPCIIATKIATKALKDGDEVEVDADKGIVKKIK